MISRHFHKRNLPHLYYNEGLYFVTYRLYGSIHLDELAQLKQSGLNKNSEWQKELFEKYDSLLDNSANGNEVLLQPEILEICKSSLQFYDAKEYRLICYCIMPNHIHLVFDLLSMERIVGDIMKSIKQFSARRINKILKQEGAFWQAESYDRLIRDEVELYFIIKYVLMNPVNAGLTDSWRKWKGTYCNPEFEVIE